MGADRQGGVPPIGSRPLKNAIAAAAVLATVAAVITVSLPTRRRALSTAWTDGTIPGIIHVHTNRSDGSRSPGDIAAAAARAGLRFIVFTDHGDATRPPDPPAYRSGVLCVDAVEISTTGGHYIAFDMPAAPYPLAGEPRDVVEDVRRLGGFGIVAHPDSPKPALQWTDWTAPFDAIEAVNLDSSWRRFVALARGSGGAGARWWASRTIGEALVAYPFRPAETIDGLTSADDGSVARQHDAPGRRVVITAGADAHAQIALRGDQWDTRSDMALPIPSYESTFRALSIHAALEHALTGNAATDAHVLARAIREGHMYVSLDGVAGPPAFEFTGTNALGTVHEGDELGEGGPVTLRVRSNAPPTFTTSIWSGARLVSGDHHEAAFAVQVPGAPAAYAVEIRATDRRHAVPWVLSNEIRVRSPHEADARPRQAPARSSEPLFDRVGTQSWSIELDAASHGTLDLQPTANGSALRLQYRLGDRPSGNEYVAVVRNTPDGVPAGDRLRIALRADRPMRVSVQLRRLSGRGAEQWQRSIYVDQNEIEHALSFQEFAPQGTATGPAPSYRDIKSVLFVVDTLNTKPSTAGTLWIDSVAVER